MISEAHVEKMSTIERAFEQPLKEYFPELQQTVVQHLETWQDFNADKNAKVVDVKQLADSLIGIADFVSKGLEDLRVKKGWMVPPPSIVRPVWKTDFLKEGSQILGFLKDGGNERKYLLYATFRREPEKYSDLTILFQMLRPGEDTGERGLEVHCRAERGEERIRAVAQCIEVYRVFSGHVDIEVDGVQHRIGPDYKYDTVTVPPGSRHRVINASGKTSQVLIVMGGGSARGYKIGKDGLIEIEEGLRISPPEAPEKFRKIQRFRKSAYV